jgi:hypothetical protein
MRTRLLWPLCGLLLTSALVPGLLAQGTVFTYQGRLTDAGELASGQYDLRFTLFGAAEFGFPIGGSITNTDVAIGGGLFTAGLDFGANAFSGDPRWLEIAVRPHGTAAFTLLAPRQSVTPAPYSVHAQTAGNALTLNGQSPAAFSPATGSSAYAPVTGSPAYVAKTGDTMTGPLAVNQDISAPRMIADGPPPGGGALALRNLGKTANAANAWELYNMTGVFGDSFQIWSYAADASWQGPMFVIYDTGTTVLAPDHGNVGIGTGRADPAAKLEVQGGPIKATGGLIIETRDADPANPVEGQIWLVK